MASDDNARRREAAVPVKGRLRAAWAVLGTCSLLGALAILVGLAVQGPVVRIEPEQRTIAGSRIGDPCRSVYRHPVAFVVSPDGSTMAHFEFAGGAVRGSLPLSAADATLAHTHDAYVTDVQLGSYEPSDPGRAGSRPVCRLNPTYHFYCPASNMLDVLCYTWVQPAIGPTRADEVRPAIAAW